MPLQNILRLMSNDNFSMQLRIHIFKLVYNLQSVEVMRTYLLQHYELSPNIVISAQFSECQSEENLTLLRYLRNQFHHNEDSYQKHIPNQ